MRIPGKSLSLLVVAAGIAVAVPSEAATIRMVQDPHLPAATPLPMHGSKSVLAESLQDPQQQSSLCVCVGHDTPILPDSTCVSAGAGGGSAAGPAESRTTLALAGALLDVPHRPVLRSALKGDGADLAWLLMGLRHPLGPWGRADPPLAFSDRIESGTGLGGGGSHAVITAGPPPAPGPAVAGAIPAVPLPASGLLLIGALAGALTTGRCLRRRIGWRVTDRSTLRTIATAPLGRT